jgi:hypothetical protein
MELNVVANELRLLLFVLLFVGLGMRSEAAEVSVRLTGTFSSFEFHQESGDLNGLEIRIIRVRNGMKGVVQFAEGGAGDVLLIDISTAGNDVTFSSPDGYQPAFKFEGHVSQKGLSGKISYSSGASEQVVLKRQQSYWDQ